MSNEFSTRAGKKFLKSQTEKRVSKKASDTLAKQMEKAGLEIASKAKEIAKKDGRKTVREVDIKKAVKEERETKIEVTNQIK